MDIAAALEKRLASLDSTEKKGEPERVRIEV